MRQLFRIPKVVSIAKSKKKIYVVQLSNFLNSRYVSMRLVQQLMFPYYRFQLHRQLDAQIEEKSQNVFAQGPML